MHSGKQSNNLISQAMQKSDPSSKVAMKKSSRLKNKYVKQHFQQKTNSFQIVTNFEHKYIIQLQLKIVKGCCGCLDRNKTYNT